MEKKIDSGISRTEARALNVLRRTRVLIADDDAEMRKLIGWHLRALDCEVFECPNWLGFLEHPALYSWAKKISEYDLVISDIRMPGVTGTQVLEQIQDHEPRPPIILITAFGDEATEKLARKLGAAALFNKPFEMDDLIDVVRNQLVARQS